jgi:hypothetical protein
LGSCAPRARPDQHEELYPPYQGDLRIILTYLSGLIAVKFVTFVTSLPPCQTDRMDKIDYEAKLAAEVQKLAEYQKALEQEHSQINSEAHDGAPILDAQQVYKAAEQKLLSAVAQAADTVVELLTYADKDATKFTVAKFVLDLAKGHNAAENSEHPFEEILRKIGAKTTEDAG